MAERAYRILPVLLRLQRCGIRSNQNPEIAALSARPAHAMAARASWTLLQLARRFSVAGLLWPARKLELRMLPEETIKSVEGCGLNFTKFVEVLPYQHGVVFNRSDA